MSKLDEMCKCGHPIGNHVIEVGKGRYACAHGLWGPRECPCMVFKPAKDKKIRGE